jgi:hypothetical protein
MKRLLTVAALTALLMTAGGVANSDSANAGGSLYDGCGYGGCCCPRYSYNTTRAITPTPLMPTTPATAITPRTTTRGTITILATTRTVRSTSGRTTMIGAGAGSNQLSAAKERAWLRP